MSRNHGAPPRRDYMKSLRISLVIVGLVFFLATTSSHAQMAGTGQIVGTVMDPSGAAIVGAEVSLTDAATGDTRTSTSNDAGRYVFSNLPPGKYDVTINKQ